MRLGCEAIRAADALRAAGHAVMADQIERAAGSVHANVAEGSGRASSREFRRFDAIAGASLRELESHLILARAVRRLPPADCDALRARIRRVSQLLHGLHESLS